MKQQASVPFDLIASDYDLTLATYPGGIVGERTLDRIRSVRELGVHMAVISGRSTGGLTNHLRRHAIDFEGLYVGGYNGAEVTQGWDGEVIASFPLPIETVLSVMDELVGRPVQGVIPHGQHVYTADANPILARLESNDNETILHRLGAWDELPMPAHKVLMGGETRDLQDAVAHLRKVLGDAVEIAFSAPMLVEVNARGVSKGLALRALANHLDVPIQRTLTFGDNENDIPLIKEAGVGVAMGNAIDALKISADRITNHVEDDGVADILEEYFSVS